MRNDRLSLISMVHNMQGYIVYSVKQKLKQEFVGLPANEIKKLKLSGVEVCGSLFFLSSEFTLAFIYVA